MEELWPGVACPDAKLSPVCKWAVLSWRRAGGTQDSGVTCGWGWQRPPVFCWSYSWASRMKMAFESNWSLSVGDTPKVLVTVAETGQMHVGSNCLSALENTRMFISIPDFRFEDSEPKAKSWIFCLDCSGQQFPDCCVCGDTMPWTVKLKTYTGGSRLIRNKKTKWKKLKLTKFELSMQNKTAGMWIWKHFGWSPFSS